MIICSITPNRVPVFKVSFINICEHEKEELVQSRCLVWILTLKELYFKLTTIFGPGNVSLLNVDSE